ncbi:hypothetical protein D3C81_1630400 [compost metagenome]
MYLSPCSTSRARVCRARASARFCNSNWLTVPSSSQAVTIAVITPGVFQVVAMIVRSNAAIH